MASPQTLDSTPSSNSDPAGGSSFAEFAKRTALIAAVVLGAWLLGAAVQGFLVLFLAILFAVFIRSISGWLARHSPLSGRWAVVATLLGLSALLAGIILLVAPRTGTQFVELGKTLPESFSQLRSHAMEYEWSRYAMNAAEDVEDYLPDPRVMFRQAAGVFSSTFGAASVLLVVLFFGVCLAIEPRTYLRGLLHLVPLHRRPRVGQVVDEIGSALALWLLSVLMSMSIVGIFTGVGLWLLGIPLFFVLGLLAFLLCFIPNIGPILAAAPAVIIAFSISPEKALHVVILYLGVQTLESYFITPFIQRKTVSLPPALTGVAQLVLALFTGLLGVIVAAPLMAVAMVVVRRFYVEDALGDHTVEEDSATSEEATSADS